MGLFLTWSAVHAPGSWQDDTVKKAAQEAVEGRASHVVLPHPMDPSCACAHRAHRGPVAGQNETTDSAAIFVTGTKVYNRVSDGTR